MGNTQRNLKPVLPIEKPIGKRTMKQLVGRKFKKPILNPPVFDDREEVRIDFSVRNLWMIGIKKFLR